MAKMTLRCDSFRPFRRSTLVGFAELFINELRLRIKDVAFHQVGDSRWASLPAKPMLKDGVQMKDERGKAQYVNILEWENRYIRDAFSVAAIEAVLAHTPSAFDDPSPRSESTAKTNASPDIPF